MATTWTGTIGELSEAGGAIPQASVFRDGDDLDGVTFPYATVIDPVSLAPALRGDAATLGRFRDLQVDVWQRRDALDADLVDAVVAALDGAKALGARLTVTLVVSVPEPVDDGIVHHSLTVRAGATV